MRELPSFIPFSSPRPLRVLVLRYLAAVINCARREENVACAAAFVRRLRLPRPLEIDLIVQIGPQPEDQVDFFCWSLGRFDVETGLLLREFVDSVFTSMDHNPSFFPDK